MGRKPSLKKNLVLISYLKEEVLECKNICESAKREMEVSIRQAHFDLNVHDDSLDSPMNPAGQESNPGAEEQQLDEEEAPESSKKEHPPWAKSSFRNIARATHPDKLRDNLSEPLRKKFLDSYQKAKESIDCCDYVELLVIASDLGTDIQKVDSSCEALLEKKKDDLSARIRAYKKSMYWIWAHSTDEEKEKMLKVFIDQRGWATKEKQRTKSRKGPGNHPGKSLAQIKKMKILKPTKDKK